MKMILTCAAAIAALSASSAASASASERGPGHWEWQSRSTPGPNKSNPPSHVRVWVKDRPQVAQCECAMMPDAATAATCIGTRRSKG